MVAKAAYNAREKLLDERTGEMKDYRDRDAALFSGIFAPKDAPEWAHDRERLWNAVEQNPRDKRKDAQLAIELDGALPHEFTDQQREWLVKDFVREQFQRKGIIADVNIHPPPCEPEEGKQPNHHFHVLLVLREIGPDGFGERILNTQDRELEKARVENWREAWERTVNRHLERHGFEERIDRRTLEEQGIDREPTKHRGPVVDAMERKGIETDRGRDMREAETSPTPIAAKELTATAEMNRELTAAVKEAREVYQRDRQIEWWQRIEDAIERGAGSNAAWEHQSEGERPEGWPARIESAATLEQMRGLRTELAEMRRDIRLELQDETLSRENHAALRETAAQLRDLHYDTNREIAALALEQSGYEPKVMEMGRAGLNDLAQNIEAMGGAALDLVGGLADRASKMAEGLIDFFITPSRPTPEMVQARQQAREEAAEAAIDWKRYKTEEAYRDMIDERDRLQREQDAQRRYYERGRDDRER